MRKRPSLSEPTRAYSYHQIASAIFDEVGFNWRDEWITGIHVHVSLKFMGSFLSFSPIFFQRDSFYDVMFASMDKTALQQWGLKKQILSFKS